MAWMFLVVGHLWLPRMGTDDWQSHSDGWGYRVLPTAALLMPLTGIMHTLVTLGSARRFATGRGGGWKGRTYGRHGPEGEVAAI